MKHPSRLLSAAALAAMLLLGAPGLAAQSALESNDTPQSEKDAYPIAEPDGALLLNCSISRPSQILRYYVTCSNATQLDFSIADCCISGDHWQLKGKIWDANPNSAVTTAPGPAGAFGIPARVYTYGGTAFDRTLRALVECTYLHGVNVFPAGSTIRLRTNGTCTITQQLVNVEDEIDRSP